MSEAPDAASSFQKLGVEAVARCDLFSRPPFSAEPGALTRLYLTRSHRAALDQLTEWMTAIGMQVRSDQAATLIGRYEGAVPGAKALLIGSHIDSVRNAGSYDGALGVMLGLSCVGHLVATGRRLPFAIELVVFGDEEGSRFHATMTGSCSMAGTLEPAALTHRDADGISVEQALRDFGLDPARISENARQPGELLLYFEAHIEQGPVLEALNLPVGVVLGIAAQVRLAVDLEGFASHAGTTPMEMRRDALAAAAEAILLVEQIARGQKGLVGTVGTITVQDGSGNVVPGKVRFSVDLRAPSAAGRDAAEEEFRTKLQAIAERRGISSRIETVQRLAPCVCNPQAVALLADAVAAHGIAVTRMTSGAGHDAMSLAQIVPVAMLFIRCAGGISHNPAEKVALEDVAVAAATMLRFIDLLAAQHSVAAD